MLEQPLKLSTLDVGLLSVLFFFPRRKFKTAFRNENLVNVLSMNEAGYIKKGIPFS